MVAFRELMLVDYHIHLEKDTHFAKCPYTAENIEAYLEVAKERGIDELGITEHCNRFQEFSPLMKELTEGEGAYPQISGWLQGICTEKLDEYVGYLLELKGRGYPIKIGIEVDYIAGKVDEIKEILAPYPWDYILGSVHFLGKWAIDFSRGIGWPGRRVDDVYQEYIETLTRAATSELFDVLAHLDLVKKFGHRPEGDMSRLWSSCLDSIAQKGLVVEISTAGLRKKVRELYPSEWLLRQCRERGVPITLASDAHDAVEVGIEMEKALHMAQECGYTEVCTFDGRRKVFQPLG